MVTLESDRADAAARLREATGRATVGDSCSWIANGYPLAAQADIHLVLRDLVLVQPDGPDWARALELLTRSIARSDVDSAAILFKPEAIVPARRFRDVLERLVAHSPGRRLSSVTANAVIATQGEDPFTVEVVCAVAGLSYRDLAERVPNLPSDPTGPWQPSAVRAAFQLIDGVVTGRVVSNLPGTVPTRPLDLMPSVAPARGNGWEAVEREFVEGVPYEVLLAQRVVGGTWLAHRNATSGLINHGIVSGLCAELERAGLAYRRSTLVGGDVSPSVIQELAASDKQTGVVVLDGLGRARYAVVAASARDSGTASKSAAKLRAMRRNEALPTAVLLSGGGWAARNETADLAAAFGGRLFSDRGIDALVRDIVSVIRLAARQP
jgi:hypothetical protein